MWETGREIEREWEEGGGRWDREGIREKLKHGISFSNLGLITVKTQIPTSWGPD